MLGDQAAQLLRALVERGLCLLQAGDVGADQDRPAIGGVVEADQQPAAVVAGDLDRLAPVPAETLEEPGHGLFDAVEAAPVHGDDAAHRTVADLLQASSDHGFGRLAVAAREGAVTQHQALLGVVHHDPVGKALQRLLEQAGHAVLAERHAFDRARAQAADEGAGSGAGRTNLVPRRPVAAGGVAQAVDELDLGASFQSGKGAEVRRPVVRMDECKEASRLHQVFGRETGQAFGAVRHPVQLEPAGPSARIEQDRSVRQRRLGGCWPCGRGKRGGRAAGSCGLLVQHGCRRCPRHPGLRTGNARLGDGSGAGWRPVLSDEPDRPSSGHADAQAAMTIRNAQDNRPACTGRQEQPAVPCGWTVSAAGIRSQGQFAAGGLSAPKTSRWAAREKLAGRDPRVRGRAGRAS